MKQRLVINGFEVNAVWDKNTVESILLPLLETWKQMQRQSGNRLIVFLAAPPATGKSTLAAYLEMLSGQLPDMPSLQAVGMDGFHYPQAYIAAHTVMRGEKEVPMQQVKGAPETFDADKLKETLQRLRHENLLWPIYDRTLHDVVPDAVHITADIVLVEGNYLLLDAEEWRELPHDYAVFIRAEENQLRERLINRKMRGGATKEQALSHYETADGPNVCLTLEKQLPADAVLRMTGDGKLER